MKEYNDYRLATESTQNIIRQKFDESIEMEVKDLEDIYEKMLDQKKQLEANNSNGSLNSALQTTNENINEIQSLISKYTLRSQQSQRRFNLQKNPQSSEKFGYNNIRSFNNPESVHGKIPSSEEIARHTTNNSIPSPNLGVTPPPQPNQNMGNLTPENGAIYPNLGSTLPSQPNNNVNFSDGNSPSQDGAISPRNNEVSSRNSRRGNPMQGNLLSALAKAFFVKNKPNKGKRLVSINIQPIVADHRRNRFHNIIIQGEHCDPRRKLVTSQLDLLRLLILFIALRPHSRYCARIASITNNQFEVLLSIT